MSSFETLLAKHSVGSTFGVNPEALQLSAEAFDAQAKAWEAGKDPRVKVFRVHRESSTGSRHIDIVMLKRVE
nr:hypothetical protein [uncultured Cupriavidus sp.]